MTVKHRLMAIAAALCLLAPGPALFADGSIVLPRTLLGAPILQRDAKLPIQGLATPGRDVTVSFAGQTKKAKADSRGVWRLTLDPMPANAEGSDLVVGYGADDPDPTLCRDVVVGDIWLAAGQSNMEFGMSAIENRAAELKDGNYPGIRLFPIPKASSPFPGFPLQGAWFPADRRSLTQGGWYGFSAVGFMFGRKLHKETGVPIGIIEAAYGGSPIESWLSPEALAAEPELAARLKEIEAADSAWAEARKSDPKAKHRWEDVSDYRELGPAVIYRAMVEPLAPTAIKGVIWYQGESNVGDGPAYAVKMRALAKTLRTAFGNPSLPLLYVQLAPYDYSGGLPSMWAAQEAALSIPNTAMAVTADIGDRGNIHPPKKREVGDRLALLALKYAYGRTGLLADSPSVASVDVRGATLALGFRDAGSGLETKDGKSPRSFRISADGRAWFDAKAEIRGSEVILSNPKVKAPRYATFAWSDDPDVNLFNSAGLPARPWGGNKE
jgi:sialate O-acetylesterase